MTQYDLSGFDTDNRRAQQTVETIQSFIQGFKTRQEVGELQRLVNNGRLSGGILKQNFEFHQRSISIPGSDPHFPKLSPDDRTPSGQRGSLPADGLALCRDCGFGDVGRVQ